MSTPVLHLLAGPNGAGKSTLATRVLLPRTHLPFVNADILAARWPGEEVEHAYEAAELAAEQRDQLLAQRASFIAATVFSHPSKVDLVRRARVAGYLVHLQVVMVPVEVRPDNLRAGYAARWPVTCERAGLRRPVQRDRLCRHVEHGGCRDRNVAQAVGRDDPVADWAS
ncbi:MAG: zeta toxin family protein [Tetrasphaera sp.]